MEFRLNSAIDPEIEIEDWRVILVVYKKFMEYIKA